MNPNIRDPVTGKQLLPRNPKEAYIYILRSRIRERLNHLRMTTRVLGKRLGWHPNTVTYYLCVTHFWVRFPVEWLPRLANALGVTVATLVIDSQDADLYLPGWRRVAANTDGEASSTPHGSPEAPLASYGREAGETGHPAPPTP